MKTRMYPAHRLAFAVLAVWLSRVPGASELTPASSVDQRVLVSVLIALEITRDQSLYTLVFNRAIRKFRIDINDSSTLANMAGELPAI